MNRGSVACLREKNRAATSGSGSSNMQMRTAPRRLLYGQLSRAFDRRRDASVPAAETAALRGAVHRKLRPRACRQSYDLVHAATTKGPPQPAALPPELNRCG